MATEALFYLCGGLKSGLRLFCARYSGGTHWWLADECGIIYDPTACQYGKEKPPYHLGKRCGFLTGYEKPSKRAAIMMERVLMKT